MEPLMQLAQKKQQTLFNLLASRGRAWDGYFDGLSLGYLEAHKQHTQTLTAINEQIRSQMEFFRTVVLGIFLPSMLGGGMAAIVKDKGRALTALVLPVATKNRLALAQFATEGIAAVTKDTIKQELATALNRLAPKEGSEWDAVGDSPLKFFLQVRKAVNDYMTDITHELEIAKGGSVDDYIDRLHTHLLSPFIQNAPMDTTVLYNATELAPIFEIFLWVVWARERKVKYWSRQIGLVIEPDERSFVGVLLDGGLKDQDAIDRESAKTHVRDLAPILVRLIKCGINPMEITQGIATRESRANPGASERFLNILWVRYLGDKHPNTLLADLTADFTAKVPISGGKPVDKSRRLL